MVFTCPRCGFLTNTKYNIRRHFERKVICQPLLRTIPIHECIKTVIYYPKQHSLKNTENSLKNPENILQNHEKSLKNPENHENSLKNTEKRHTCIYCQKNFTRKDNMHVHAKVHCKGDKKVEIEEKIKIIENLKKENEVLKNNKNTTIQNNTINNTVIINAFGKENLTYINKEYIHGLIKEGPLKIASAIFNVTHLKNYKFFR
jgi:hypothetical protein